MSCAQQPRHWSLSNVQHSARSAPAIAPSLPRRRAPCTAGVVTLDSGLQYKVLREGDGDEHPQKDTQCNCHYEGRTAQEFVRLQGGCPHVPGANGARAA